MTPNQSEADVPTQSRKDVGWNLLATYTQLPKSFFVHVEPTKVRSPKVVVLNYQLGNSLGLDLRRLDDQLAAAIFSGNELPLNAEPIAQAYAGHQFGGFTMLGDGRAILLGEQSTPDQKLIDIQLKGSGPTPFSRRGDGRAAIGPMVREYIISEAMAALGVPTTRSLAVVSTGEPVYRERVLPGAVLTRTAASHLRVGTFEYAAARQNMDDLKALADYAIARHYPDLVDTDRPYLRFLQAVIERQAALIAKWQLIGFVHGVMNTDNVSIAGETIDYGPCAFMNTYDPATVFSSIDVQGRYAYGNQPTIAHWNIVRFAESILMLLDEREETAVELANETLEKFPDQYKRYWMQGMRAKLGLQNEHDDDERLFVDLLNWMYDAKLDFTNTFRSLSLESVPTDEAFGSTEFRSWHQRWTDRMLQEGSTTLSRCALMTSVNPSVIPRNHLVEDALAAAEAGDLAVLHQLVDVLHKPFQEPEDQKYIEPPPAGACGYKTFCGT